MDLKQDSVINRLLRVESEEEIMEDIGEDSNEKDRIRYRLENLYNFG